MTKNTHNANSSWPEHFREPLKLACQYVEDLEEVELIKIRKNLEAMIISRSSAVIWSKRFLYTYLAIRICLEVPALLADARFELRRIV